MWWPYLKPGGLYFIEDVDVLKGGLRFLRHPEKLEQRTRDLFAANEAFYVDAHVGHRNWRAWVQMVGPAWVQDHVKHNSNIIVIRKKRV